MLVASICAKRFHRHYSGQSALLNRHSRGTSAVCANEDLRRWLTADLTQARGRGQALPAGLTVRPCFPAPPKVDNVPACLSP